MLHLNLSELHLADSKYVQCADETMVHSNLH